MLSDRQIKNLTATGKPYRLREKSTDQSLRGFGVQVSAAGTKTFYMEYSFGGQRGHFYRLGAYPGLSLAQARERCREVRNLVDQGIDPKAELERRRTSEVVERKAQEQQALEARATATYEDLVRVYLESLDNATTRQEIDRLLQKDARPILKGKRVTEIDPSDIRAVLAKARKRGAKRVVFMLHSYLHAAFVYAIGEQEIDGLLFPLTTNPVAAVKKPDSGMTPCSRVLSKEEIARVWQALAMDAERMNPTTIGAIRLMLLSGQRLQEILRTRWGQLDFADATWSFSREQTKTKRPHLLPMTAMIKETLNGIPQIGGLVFPHSRQDAGTPEREMPFRSITQAIERLCTRHGIEPFTPRDLRRTCTTHWARIGIQPSVRFLLQNRAVNDIEDTHYNIYDGLPEKRRALEQWEQEIRSLMDAAAVVRTDQPPQVAGPIRQACAQP
ncbi:tyrosine-type recombinase/integrase [Thiorhodococcus minor]|uniref:Integrase arm-type DNA-binding domain-containing protein n=1 Tax=Thiorhodococcus minor TaxID=57489 RepID=A0A6M0JVR3_9GAMM|nr:site-specific integrase [Thiorhodococcus minor]NEV60407.1 integrase arm-type DNA-binding domain-containing protein [Thiorhodococcus minor]